MTGDKISQSMPRQENDDSESGEKGGGWWYLRFFGVAGIDDSSEEGSKHGNSRECISKGANLAYLKRPLEYLDGTNLHLSAYANRCVEESGMSPGQVMACYRLNAAHCLEIARDLPDRGRKIALLNMAQVWLALADEVERKASSEVLNSAEEL
ncbi:MAG: hypothetical protein WAK55_05345 [Xanthobacteraceae bacterium]